MTEFERFQLIRLKRLIAASDQNSSVNVLLQAEIITVKEFLTRMGFAAEVKELEAGAIFQPCTPRCHQYVDKEADALVKRT